MRTIQKRKKINEENEIFAKDYETKRREREGGKDEKQ